MALNTSDIFVKYNYYYDQVIMSIVIAEGLVGYTDCFESLLQNNLKPDSKWMTKSHGVLQVEENIYHTAGTTAKTGTVLVANKFIEH